VKSFFGIEGGVSLKVGWVRVPGGGILEIFEFNPQLPAQPIPWNRVGLTHFSFKRAEHPEVARLPGEQGGGDRDDTGALPARPVVFLRAGLRRNLIELIDLGFMHYVLAWGGALGGWLFRRGMYRQYYES
jgi:hypothetical protein